MQTKITENEHGLYITIKPETMEEMASLLRFSKNAKSQKPYIYMSLQNEPYCFIRMKKLSKSKQINSIIPGK